MIDTIRLKTKIKDVKEENLLSISCQKEGYTKYKIFKDTINVGSYSPDINIFIDNSSFLYIEFSLPKFLYGHNLEYAYFKDLIPVMIQIKTTMDRIGKTPPILDWCVQRIDICEYIYTKNPYEHIYLFQTLSYPRKKKYIYDTSVMFVGNSFSTKYYIKEDEFFKNDFKKIVQSDISKAYNLLEQSKGRIRLETSYRRKFLQYHIGKEIIKLKDVIDNKHKILYHFKKLKKKLNGDIDPTKMEQKNLLKELQKNYKKARALQLYSFYVFYYADEPNKKIIKEMYSRSQIYRNFKCIENVLRC